jgi:hypothetical protein
MGASFGHMSGKTALQPLIMSQGERDVRPVASLFADDGVIKPF